ncbi:sensor histidine kinase RegB [Actibacterium atlanticum]|uniref:histidine kinase n=1 Tax=Actibacterium atlanticum TaxID=1461693 RepID=A0A058ZMZ5_9RHOB|nr:ActS/PrrB/RegB family redox-sensitive histidine kinase [Actibacterium atlanticum]KCV82557.1 sensor histidine kinase RegB [Actibacterium atlanticum]
MTDLNSQPLISPHRRSHWVRLRTLIWLRWVAIIGQSVAITVAHFGFGLEINIGLCLLAIGAAICFNLTAIFVYPENKRLSEREAALTLLFDLGQLSVLLFLTGGLHNPFALLVLTPVTIAATALRQRSTLTLGVSAIIIVSVLAFLHLPLVLPGGEVKALPGIFLFGFWLSIVIGVAFLSLYASRVMSEINSMSDALLATQIALDREQNLANLGGVVAAAAHELGTPLATIKLVSGELTEELEPGTELHDDAVLIRDQADRCRDILQSMGRAGKDDLQIRSAPVANVVAEAGEPHVARGKTVHYDLVPQDGNDPREPTIIRSPEVIHGLRNLIQNAVDFAREHVWVMVGWNDTHITVRIIDDGPGFPQHLLGRIGDPYVRSRRNDPKRPGYQGMGLGLFIAKTLLERSGAELSFANGADVAQPTVPHRGAVVEVSWPRGLIESVPAQALGALGENQPF